MALVLLTVCTLPQTAAAQDPDVRYHHHDAAGNVVAITDGNGIAVWHADLRPFGRGSAPPSDRPPRFAGQPLEADLSAEDGLYHFGARWYDPFIGRFLGAEPMPLRQIRLTEPQRFNRYAYGLNNPHRYQDTTGLAPHPQQIKSQLISLANELERLGDKAYAGVARTLAAIDPVRKSTVVRSGRPMSRTVDGTQLVQEAVEQGMLELKAAKGLEGFKASLRGLVRQGVVRSGSRLGGYLVAALSAGLLIHALEQRDLGEATAIVVIDQVPVYPPEALILDIATGRNRREELKQAVNDLIGDQSKDVSDEAP